MKLIPLSKTDKFALVDDEDYEALTRVKWFYENGRASRQKYLGGGKANRKVKSIKMHRLIMGFPDGIVDHIDGNKLNNQKSNLRVCTHAENILNQKIRSDNTSGFPGVVYIKSSNKWQVRVTKGGKAHFGGTYKYFEDACGNAYGLRLFLFGEYTRDLEHL